MFDLALIDKCSDPSLKPAIVEKFIEQAGSQDPLAISVKAGDRLILISPAKTEEEAMDTIRRYAGTAVVRVGLTQFPAGVGITDVSELGPELFDPCQNLVMGTALFAKVYRIVVKWYGSRSPEAFEDALIAWRSGYFEGRAVFREPDPGELPKAESSEKQQIDLDPAEVPTQTDVVPVSADQDLGRAGIRVDLSRLGVEK